MEKHPHPHACLFLSALLFAGAGQAQAAIEVLPATAGAISEPFALDFAPDGSCYGVEFTQANRVFRIRPGGELDVVAGRRHRSDIKLADEQPGDGTDPLQASFNGLHDIAIHPDGRAFLADTFNHRIRVLDLATGAVSTFAGTGKPGFGGDGGPADQAQFNQPYCATLTPDGQGLLIADLANARVRRIDIATRRVDTIAGSGKRGLPPANAPALEAPLSGPRAVAATRDGTVYIVLREGHALVALRDGRLNLVVNRSGKPGAQGDGGPALEAGLNGPKYLAVENGEAVLIVDTENHAIRRYSPRDGTLTTVAGVLGKAGAGFGPTLRQTELKRPHGIRIDKQGRWWIADSENHRVLRGVP